MGRGLYQPGANTSDSLYLIHVGYGKAEPLKKTGPMLRNMYLLHYIAKGKGTFTVNSKTYHLQEGDVFAIFPEQIAEYQADKDDPWFCYWVGFKGSTAGEYYEAIGIDYDNPILHMENDSFAESVRKCVEYTELNENNLSQIRLTAYLLEVLSSFEQDKKASKTAKYTDMAIMYMENNCRDKIFASDVASYLGLEYSTFYRTFKKKTGISPEKYLNNIRIGQAKKFIDAGFSFKEIPEYVGISDVYYFFKLFKKVTGLTPSEYRDRIK